MAATSPRIGSQKIQKMKGKELNPPPKARRTKKTSASELLENMIWMDCYECNGRSLLASDGVSLSTEQAVKLGLSYVCVGCKVTAKVDSNTLIMKELLSNKKALETTLKKMDTRFEAVIAENENLAKRITELENQLDVKTREVAELQCIVGAVQQEKDSSANEEASGSSKLTYAAAAAKGIQGVKGKLVTEKMCVGLVSQELEDRNRRAYNVIIHNVPESKEEEGLKRKESDSTQVEAVFNQVGVSNEIKVEQLFRLGKRREENAGSRPLLVKLGSHAERELVIKKAYLCRNFVLEEGVKQVAISADRSKAEREERKNLLIQLQERLRGGEKDLVLRNNRIVKKRVETGPDQQEQLNQQV